MVRWLKYAGFYVCQRCIRWSMGIDATMLDVVVLGDKCVVFVFRAFMMIERCRLLRSRTASRESLGTVRVIVNLP